MDRSGFGIVGAENQAAQTGMHHRPSAHCARFNCSKQIALPQPMVTDVCPSLPQGNNLGMRSWVGLAKISIPSPAYDFAILYYYRPDRDLAGFQRPLGRS